MKRIESNEPISVFQKKVMRALLKGPLGKIVSLRESGESMIIEFSQMGTSRISFHVESNESSFLATKQKEEIAMTHFLLRNEVEKELKRIMERLGAKIED